MDRAERGSDGIRKTTVVTGLLPGGGSSKWWSGHSGVLVGITGPIDVKGRAETASNGSIEVSLVSHSYPAPPPSSSSSSVTTGAPRNAVDSVSSSWLSSLFSSVVLTSSYPRTRTVISVQVLRDDGSILSAAVNGIMLALLDAGIQCSTLVAAVSIGVDLGKSNSSSGPGFTLVDPTLDELKGFNSNTSVNGTWVFDRSGSVLAEVSSGAQMETAQRSSLRAAARAASGEVFTTFTSIM